MEAQRVPVLYDADCGLCARTARLVNRLDRRGRLELVPFDEARVRGLAVHLPEDALQASFHAVVGDRVLSGPEAIPAILERLPMAALPARWIRRSPFLRGLTAASYRWIAARRHRFFARACRCGAGSPVPR